VALTRDQFAQAAESVHRELLRMLHELRPAGAPVVLVVPSIVAHLPGLRDELEQFVDCELVGVPDGFAALASSRLDLPERASSEPGPPVAPITGVRATGRCGQRFACSVE